MKLAVLTLTSVLLGTQPLTPTLNPQNVTIVHESFPFRVRIDLLVSPRNPLLDVIDMRGKKTSIVFPGRMSPVFKDINHHDKLG